MIIKTGKWLANLAHEQDCSVILNGGDTFDNTVVKAEELEAISLFFKQFDALHIPHFVLVGNHEKVNDKFNVSEILSGYEDIRVISKPFKKGNLSFLPYMGEEDITEDLLKELSNELLISHIDIKGSMLKDNYVSEIGTKPELLAKYFKFVANGHLHTAERLNTSQNNVWNIGGVSSISFGDNQEYIPSAVVYNTDTETFERFLNPYTILFRRLVVSSPEGLKGQLDLLDRRFKYALTVKYDDYEKKSEIQDILDNDKNVIAYKTINVFATTTNPTGTEEVSEHCLSDLDVKQKFIEFLDTVECKYEKDIYFEILNTLGESE